MSRRGGGGGQQASARRGFKKAEPGVWWAEWCVLFPPFPSAPACFSRSALRSADVDAMSADRAQEASACLF